MCAEDLALLDKMARAAGKSRDVFISDLMFEWMTMERMILGESEKREGTNDG